MVQKNLEKNLFNKYRRKLELIEALPSFDIIADKFRGWRLHLHKDGRYSIDLTGKDRLLFWYKPNGEIEIIEIDKVADPHGNKV